MEMACYSICFFSLNSDFFDFYLQLISQRTGMSFRLLSRALPRCLRYGRSQHTKVDAVYIQLGGGGGVWRFKPVLQSQLSCLHCLGIGLVS